MQPQNTILLRTRQTFAFIGLFACFAILYRVLGDALSLHNGAVNTFVGAFVAVATYYFIVRKYAALAVKAQLYVIAAVYTFLPVLVYISLSIPWK